MTEARPRKQVNIYTDGACSGNPGPGGWGCILEFGPHRKEMSGYMAGTTNNRMELFAAISALGALKEPCDVKLYSDSAYLVNAFNEALASYGIALELDLIPSDQYQVVCQTRLAVGLDADWMVITPLDVQTRYQNIRCDELATGAIKEYRRINAMDEESKA